jgi:hypothetical protein
VVTLPAEIRGLIGITAKLGLSVALCRRLWAVCYAACAPGPTGNAVVRLDLAARAADRHIGAAVKRLDVVATDGEPHVVA